MDTNVFVGMSKSGAQNKVEALNMIFRLVAVDGVPFLGLPEDKRDDRVCVEITKAKVSAAIIQ